MIRLGKHLAVAAALTTTAVLAPPALAGPASPAGPAGPGDPVFSETVVDADQSFRGLDAVDRRTAWATGSSVSGGDASVWRTTDGGDTWHEASMGGVEGLSLRDVHAFDADSAVVLAIGPGEDSRIYRTDDGGATWSESFRNPDEAAFYNCLDFYPGGRRGLAVSDPVDGKFRILSTDDGGRSWSVLPDAGMPDSDGEFNFSASGDCLVIEGRTAWFGSGGSRARVFASTDRGRTWTASESTIPADETAGVFGLAFRNPREGVAVGGDFADPADGADATARTTDGRTWTGAGDLTHLGEDAAWLPGARRTVLVTGESGDVGGTSISTDGGRTWEPLGTTGWHTLDCTRDGSCWAAGGGGRVARALLR